MSARKTRENSVIVFEFSSIPRTELKESTYYPFVEAFPMTPPLISYDRKPRSSVTRRHLTFICHTYGYGY